MLIGCNSEGQIGKVRKTAKCWKILGNQSIERRGTENRA